VTTTEYLALKLKPIARKYHFLMEVIPTEDIEFALGGTSDSKFGADPDS
jgi:hypothetical protein